MQNFEEAVKYGQRKIAAREGKAKLEQGSGLLALESVFCSMIVGLSSHWAIGVLTVFVLTIALMTFRQLRIVFAVVFSAFYATAPLMFAHHIATQAGDEFWLAMGLGALGSLIVFSWSMSLHRWGFRSLLSDADAAKQEAEQGMP